MTTQRIAPELVPAAYAATGLRWEYKCVSTPREPNLPQLGQEGWELVTTIVQQQISNMTGHPYTDVEWVFKRPILPDGAAAARLVFGSEEA